MSALYCVLLGVPALGGARPLLSPVMASLKLVTARSKFVFLSMASRQAPLVRAGSASEAQKLWTLLEAPEPYSATLVAVLGHISKLVSSPGVRRIFICGAAPRDAVSQAASRFLDTVSHQCRHADIDLVWIDTNSAIPSAATFAFGRSLHLIPLPMLVSWTRSFPFEALRISSCPSLSRASISWPQKVQDEATSHLPQNALCTFIGAGRLIQPQFCVSIGPMHSRMLRCLCEPLGWLILRKTGSVFMSLVETHRVLVARFDTRWATFVPVTTSLLLGYVIGECDDEPAILSGLERHDIQESQGHPCRFSSMDPLAPVLRMGWLGDAGMLQAKARAESLFANDILKVVQQRDATPGDQDQSGSSEQYTQSSDAQIPVVEVTVVGKVCGWYKALLNSEIRLENASRCLRELERSFRKSESKAHRREAKFLVTEHLTDSVILSPRELRDTLVDEGEAGYSKLMLYQAQFICRLEIERLRDDPVDPLPRRMLKPLLRMLCTISALSASTSKTTLPQFLDGVLYKQYGMLLRQTLCEFYEQVDLQPPCHLVALPSLASERLPSSPHEPEPEGKEFQPASPSNMLSSLPEPTRNKRRRSLNNELSSASRRRLSRVRWTRSKRDSTQISSVDVSLRRSTVAAVSRLRHRRQSAPPIPAGYHRRILQEPPPNSPVPLSPEASSSQPHSSSSVLALESPARQVFTPRRQQRLHSLGLVVSESPPEVIREAAAAASTKLGEAVPRPTLKRRCLAFRRGSDGTTSTTDPQDLQSVHRSLFCCSPNAADADDTAYDSSPTHSDSLWHLTQKRPLGFD